MDYLTVKQTAAKWDVSDRWVHKLLKDGRVEGATRFGSAWMIPVNVGKPIDPRIIRRERGEPYHIGKKEDGGNE